MYRRGGLRELILPKIFVALLAILKGLNGIRRPFS
jgi:hypothetical protein